MWGLGWRFQACIHGLFFLLTSPRSEARPEAPHKNSRHPAPQEMSRVSGALCPERGTDQPVWSVISKLPRLPACPFLHKQADPSDSEGWPDVFVQIRGADPAFSMEESEVGGEALPARTGGAELSDWGRATCSGSRTSGVSDGRCIPLLGPCCGLAPVGRGGGPGSRALPQTAMGRKGMTVSSARGPGKTLERLLVLSEC